MKGEVFTCALVISGAETKHKAGRPIPPATVPSITSRRAWSAHRLRGKSREAVPAPTMQVAGHDKDHGLAPRLRRWRGFVVGSSPRFVASRVSPRLAPGHLPGWPHRPPGKWRYRRQDRVARRRSPGARLRCRSPAPPVRESMRSLVGRRVAAGRGGRPGQMEGRQVEPGPGEAAGTDRSGKRNPGHGGPNRSRRRPARGTSGNSVAQFPRQPLPACSQFRSCHVDLFAFDHWAIENRRICRLQ